MQSNNSLYKNRLILSTSLSAPGRIQTSGNKRNLSAAPTSIVSLPVEITNKIFTICWYASSSQYTTDGQRIQEMPFEVVVSHVCGYWRDISLGTPSLWSAVRIGPFSCVDSTTAYLSRSQHHPLRLLLEDVGNLSHDALFSILEPHFPRLQRLRIEAAHDRDVFPLLRCLRMAQFPRLEHADLQIRAHSPLARSARDLTPFTSFGARMPALTSLWFDGLYTPFNFPRSNITSLHLHAQARQAGRFEHTIILLRALAPTLTELCIHTHHLISPPAAPLPRDLVVLPHLRKLRICSTWATTCGVSCALAVLDCPALEHLTFVRSDDYSVHQFFQDPKAYRNRFPALATLVLQDASFTEATYRRFFAAMPNVQRVAFWSTRDGEESGVNTLLRGLTHGVKSALFAATQWPRLRDVDMRLSRAQPDPYAITAMLDSRAAGGHAVEFGLEALEARDYTRRDWGLVQAEGMVFRGAWPDWDECGACLALGSVPSGEEAWWKR
ncbi:hypothetical protein BV22DRAFT_1051704 [Leucogyrophana mollusca]|uniref:Uncharacterized protein n=1 Tax=Leucogyrophana mollusca TaxID=85980 RepID=A0ACB8AZR4_9AGAM|nr:hypothetical protein BV22DRAFT_1051704 [Leucogyrophana mollusca]